MSVSNLAVRCPTDTPNVKCEQYFRLPAVWGKTPLQKTCGGTYAVLYVRTGAGIHAGGLFPPDGTCNTLSYFSCLSLLVSLRVSLFSIFYFLFIFIYFFTLFVVFSAVCSLRVLRDLFCCDPSGCRFLDFADLDVLDQLLFQRNVLAQVNGRPVPGAKKENFELEFKVRSWSSAYMKCPGWCLRRCCGG